MGTAVVAVGHSFAARGGMEVFDGCGRVGSFKWATTPVGWGSDTNATCARPRFGPTNPRPGVRQQIDLRSVRSSGGSCCSGAEGASAGAVAQGVVDAFDQFTGGGDAAWPGRGRR
jgi:hypothetical protein